MNAIKVDESEDTQLLARFDEILDEILDESYPNYTEEVLCDVRHRFAQLIAKGPIDPSLISGLDEIVSYPGNLVDSDIKILEAILAYLKPSPKI